MAGTRTVDVEAAGAGQRLDAWLARTLPDLSRARIQALIAEGAVTVDGASSRASSRVRAGQHVEVAVPELLPVLRGLSSLYIYRAEFDKGAAVAVVMVLITVLMTMFYLRSMTRQEEL